MQTENVVVAVIGLDQPGVIACVSERLSELGCNTEEVTQSALKGQFAAIYLVNKPSQISNVELNAELIRAVEQKKLRLSVITRDFEEPPAQPQESEPFVISVYGPDRNDIVATFAHIFSAYQINIESLRAFPLSEGSSMQVFEVSVPRDLDRKAVHRVLLDRGRTMNLSVTMQHRAIFEAVHRIEIF